MLCFDDDDDRDGDKNAKIKRKKQQKDECSGRHEGRDCERRKKRKGKCLGPAAVQRNMDILPSS
jgi:hypothetical protein